MLADGLCLDRTALRADADNVLRHFADLVLIAGTDKAQNIAHLLLVDLLALRGQRQQRFQRPRTLIRRLDIALHLQLGAAVRDPDAELRFDPLDIFIKGAEHVDQLLDPLGIDSLFNHLHSHHP